MQSNSRVETGGGAYLHLLNSPNSKLTLGMNIGLMPVTGIPLPFISYGVSSLMSILFGLGLVQSVAVQSSPVVFGGSILSPGWARSVRTTLRPR